MSSPFNKRPSTVQPIDVSWHAPEDVESYVERYKERIDDEKDQVSEHVMEDWQQSRHLSKSHSRFSIRLPAFLIFVTSLLSFAILIWLIGRPCVPCQNFGWVSCVTPYERFSRSFRDKTQPDDIIHDERVLGNIPFYVFKHAPLIHLYSREEFWPCEMPDHLSHITPYHNYEPLPSTRNHYNLRNLDELNRDGRFVYLQSKDNVEDRPNWLSGRKNIPVGLDVSNKDDLLSRDNLFYSDKAAHIAQDPLLSTRKDARQMRQPKQRNEHRQGGRSSAPAVLVTIDKGNGIVDAFWFFFYCYNLGNKVLNIRFGNHVGDWEHTLVRFKNGEPHEVFFSEHSWGEAYTWNAVEKYGQRPVGYSAVGTHAMYGTPGTHRYILPLGLLHDETDKGPLWDPLLNSHTYTYTLSSDTLLPSNHTPTAPVPWFYFVGHWGDKSYPMTDSRQYQLAGQYHYVNGPIGPRFKNLGRSSVCQGDPEDCFVRNVREDDELPRIWEDYGRGEELSMEDRKNVLNSTRWPEDG